MRSDRRNRRTAPSVSNLSDILHVQGRAFGSGGSGIYPVLHRSHAFRTRLGRLRPSAFPAPPAQPTHADIQVDGLGPPLGREVAKHPSRAPWHGHPPCGLWFALLARPHSHADAPSTQQPPSVRASRAPVAGRAGSPFGLVRLVAFFHTRSPLNSPRSHACSPSKHCQTLTRPG